METSCSQRRQRWFAPPPLYACGIVLLAAACGCTGGGNGIEHGDAAKHYIEAMKVRTENEARCLELLTKSIDALPTGSAYFHRAWIHAKRGAIAEASEDARRGLEIEPESSDLQWLTGELNKPEKARSFKAPPSASK